MQQGSPDGKILVQVLKRARKIEKGKGEAMTMVVLMLLQPLNPYQGRFRLKSNQNDSFVKTLA